jgi:translation initiation factor IF-2
MRTRGSRVADLAILVVAADDGVKPQTLEALRIIKNAGLPMVVAINKIDKPDANVNRVKKELSNHGIIPEEWGGNNIIVPISATTGEGIDKLIEMLLLLSEAEKERLKADWERLPIGTVIESHMDKSEGTAATILVQAGTLKIGNIVSIDGMFYGKIRVMKDHVGKRLPEATPGTPVEVLGLKTMPTVGDIVEIVRSEKGLERKIKTASREQFAATPAPASSDEKGEAPTSSLKLVVKTDTLGSAEAIVESIAKINLPQGFGIDIIQRGLGSINENDLKRAKAAGAVIVGFHVTFPTALKASASEDVLEIKLFEIIYDLINYLKEKIKALAKPTITERTVGELMVLKLFKKSKRGQIIGCSVTKGEVRKGLPCDIVRKGATIGHGTIAELQSGKETVREVKKDEECGILLNSFIDIEEGDALIAKERTETNTEV